MNHHPVEKYVSKNNHPEYKKYLSKNQFLEKKNLPCNIPEKKGLPRSQSMEKEELDN